MNDMSNNGATTLKNFIETAYFCLHFLKLYIKQKIKKKNLECRYSEYFKSTTSADYIYNADRQYKFIDVSTPFTWQQPHNFRIQELQ